MLTRRLTTVLGLTLCLVTSSAMADMLTFSVNSLQSTFDGSTFTASKTADPVVGSMGSLIRYEAPSSAAGFLWSTLATGDFSLSMQIADVVSGPTFSATGTGSFTLTDADGDTLAGDIAGQWTRMSNDSFHGSLSNVMFTDNGVLDNSFDGHFGSVSMSFATASPWTGGITDLVVGDAPWFGAEWVPGGYVGGSVDATVTAVPAPTALLLGLLGLGSTGLKLRRYV